MNAKDTNKPKDLNSRRDFLKTTAFFAIAVSIPAAVLSCGDKTKPEPQGGDCKTTDDILGPFYKANAPMQENIAPTNSTGIPLIIKGKVFSSCETILPNAVVEIWNADEKGNYDNVGFLYRGRYKTGTDGFYRFGTIVPGKYLNGSTYRPSHIHFRITAPDHKELVSQIYFKDDPYINSDPWANAPKAKERILLMEKDANGTNIVNFDIRLEKA